MTTTAKHPTKPTLAKGPAAGHVVYAISPVPQCDGADCGGLELYSDGWASEDRASLQFHCRRCGKRLTVSFTHSTAEAPPGWEPEIPLKLRTTQDDRLQGRRRGRRKNTHASPHRASPCPA
jgi:hypothetical protein